MRNLIEEAKQNIDIPPKINRETIILLKRLEREEIQRKAIFKRYKKQIRKVCRSPAKMKRMKLEFFEKADYHIKTDKVRFINRGIEFEVLKKSSEINKMLYWRLLTN